MNSNTEAIKSWNYTNQNIDAHKNIIISGSSKLDFNKENHGNEFSIRDTIKLVLRLRNEL